MLNTNGDIISEVIVRANLTTTSAGLYTDDILGDWATNAHRWAAGYRKWPVTEGRVSSTFTGSEDNSYPEGWKSDSIRYLTIGGERFQKLNFEDYQIFRENEPNSDDKVFSDFGRIVYVNPNASASGTLMTYGQYLPAAFDNTDLTMTTVFSGSEEEANEALVEEMLKYSKEREKLYEEAELHHRKATAILDGVWDRLKAEQFGYHGKGRGMFERFDILEGATNDELLKRDQFF